MHHLQTKKSEKDQAAGRYLFERGLQCDQTKDVVTSSSRLVCKVQEQTRSEKIWGEGQKVKIGQLMDLFRNI